MIRIFIIEKLLPVVTGVIIGALVTWQITGFRSNETEEAIEEAFEKTTEELKINKEIILIGSGTVMSFLTDSISSNLISDVHFLSGPSQIGLEVLLSNNDQTETPIPLVSMSSTNFNEEKLNQLKTQFKNEKNLYYMKLAEDELRVTLFSTNNYFNNYFSEKSDFLTLETLKNILESDTLSFDLYLTNPKSGTRIEFKEKLNYENFELIQSETKQIKTYDKLSSKSLVENKKNAIILSSVHYLFENEDDQTDIFPIVTGQNKLYRDLGLYILEDNEIKPNFKTAKVTIAGERGTFLRKMRNEINNENESGESWNIVDTLNGVYEID